LRIEDPVKKSKNIWIRFPRNLADDLRGDGAADLKLVFAAFAATTRGIKRHRDFRNER
jgi:hypothetical protein